VASGGVGLWIGGAERGLWLSRSAQLSNCPSSSPVRSGRGRMDKKQATPHVDAWIQEHVDSQERERFREAGEVELLSLHEGNFARYQIRPFEFTAWREVWGK